MEGGVMYDLVRVSYLSRMCDDDERRLLAEPSKSQPLEWVIYNSYNYINITNT